MQNMKGCMIMALSLCFHFFGYECARAASMSLIAVKNPVLENVGMQFIAVFGFVASAATLHVYTLLLRSLGPQWTFRISNIACSMVLVIMFVCSCMGDSLDEYLRLWIAVLFYIFREIYVTLVSTQQWAYIVTLLHKSKSSWIVFIGGCISVTSTMSGYSVAFIVQRFGIPGLIFVALSNMLISSILGELAFNAQTTSYSRRLRGHGHGKRHERKRSSVSSQVPINIPEDQDDCQKSVGPQILDSNRNNDIVANMNGAKDNKDSRKESKSVWRASIKLIAGHSTLRLLFCEAVVHQCCANFLHLMFLQAMRLEVPDSTSRASLVGRFFAQVNLCSCILQLCIVPQILAPASVPIILAGVPVVVLLTSIVVVKTQSLSSIMLCFGALKVLEYAVMSGAMEMIFMPMNLEVRLVGKEFVRFYGHKGGKSVSAAVLAAFTSVWNVTLLFQSQCFVALAAGWCTVMLTLCSQLKLDHSNPEEGPVLVTTIDEKHESKVKKQHRHTDKGEPYGRARLNSNTSNTSAESLPDDDYFVGEGVAVSDGGNSNMDQLAEQHLTTVSLPSPQVRSVSDAEYASSASKSTPMISVSSGSGSASIDHSTRSHSSSEKMFLFEELPSSPSPDEVSEDLNAEVPPVAFDSIGLNLDRQHVKHRAGNAKRSNQRLGSRAASSARLSNAPSFNMEVGVVGVVFMDEELSEQVLSEIRLKSPTSQILDTFKTSAVEPSTYVPSMGHVEEHAQEVGLRYRSSTNSDLRDMDQSIPHRSRLQGSTAMDWDAPQRVLSSHRTNRSRARTLSTSMSKSKKQLKRRARSSTMNSDDEKTRIVRVGSDEFLHIEDFEFNFHTARGISR